MCVFTYAYDCINIIDVCSIHDIKPSPADGCPSAGEFCSLPSRLRRNSLIQVCSDIDGVMVGGGASVAHGEGGDEEVAL